MKKLYQLMIGMDQIDDVYHDEDDAIERAKQLTLDTGIPVSIWEAEEIEGIPVDVLDWTTLTTFVLEDEKMLKNNIVFARMKPVKEPTALPHTIPFEYLRTHKVAYNSVGGVDMILTGDSLSKVPREDWEELEDFLIRTEGNYSVIRSTLNGVECRLSFLSFKNQGVDLEGYDTEPDIIVILSVSGLVVYTIVKEFEYCGNLNTMFGNIHIDRD